MSLPFQPNDLAELAGWEAMKKARALVAAGCVVQVALDTPSEEEKSAAWTVRGMVVEGRKKYRCVLVVRSPSDADNLCSCPAARREGRICEHSLALALQAAKEPVDPGKEEPQVSKSKSATADFTQNAWLPELGIPLAKMAGTQRIPLRLVAPPDDLEIPAEVGEAIRSSLSDLGVEFGSGSQMLTLKPNQFQSLLAAGAGGQFPLAASGSREGGVGSLRIAETITRIPLELERAEDDGLVQLRRPSLEDALFVVSDEDLWLIRLTPRLAMRLPLAELPKDLRQDLLPLFADAALETGLEFSLDWLKTKVEQLHCLFHMECSDDLIESIRVVEGVPEVSLSVEGSLNHLDLLVGFEYAAEESPNLRMEQGALMALGRREWGAVSEVSADELPVGRRRRGVRSAIKGENAILDFYAGPLARIISEGKWDVQIGERFARLTREIEIIRPRAETAARGEDWLSFDLSFRSDAGTALSEAEVRRLLDTGQSRTRSADGRRLALDRGGLGELFDALGEIETEQAQDGAGRRAVKTSQQYYLQEVIGGFCDGSSPPDGSEIPVLSDLEARLRPYQERALGWLHQRSSAGLGAILADEMGLGKTVQTLALVAALCPKAAPAAEKAPVLIVCPTSLLGTWQRDVERFLPKHHVLLLHGPQRSRYFDVMASADIVLTSFGSLVRDLPDYPELEFRLAVVDEASYLKNPRTKTTKAAWGISARARLALTGTPVENSLQDLWSIMQFANPGYLGRRDDFLARYGAANPEVAGRLRKRLAPYLLRRTKLEVAPDLPDKIERVLYCELAPKQRSAYEQLLRNGRENFKNIQNSLDWNKSRMEVLTLLLRLRQTCCDLRLVAQPDKAEGISGKLEALDTLLEEAIPGGHRILLFSQFVSMLSLLKEHLDAKGLRYLYLDGSTPAEERAAQVETFQSQEEIPIFLISLKAGGYGLTLTGADTVIHFDPWWNPAVEAQATDRAHRIGQTRPVTAYKLITTGTVEEKILQLQQRKRHLVDATLDESRPLMSSLTPEDIEFVLS